MYKKVCRKFTLLHTIDEESGAYVREAVYLYTPALLNSLVYPNKIYQPNRAELHYFMMGLCTGLGKEFMYDEFDPMLDSNLPIIDIRNI